MDLKEPKMKIEDELLLQEFRDKLRCEWCQRTSRRSLAPHHWYARGMGGGSRLDIRENLIGLCADCHRQAHTGEIDRESLLAVIAQREGLQQDQVREIIWAALRADKETDRDEWLETYRSRQRAEAS